MLLEDAPLFKTVISLPVTALPFDAHMALILKWAKCLNGHSFHSVQDFATIRQAVNSSML